MSSIYCPCTDPTTVEHSVCAFLISRHEKNLIIAKKNLLQIYKLVQREEDLSSAVEQRDTDQDNQVVHNDDDFIGAGMSIRQSERQIVSKLVLITEYRLYGTVVSLGALRSKYFNDTGLEYVLVGFESAKASLLRWDHNSDNITTISLHSFDREEYHSPLRRSVTGVMRIDPLSRVATLSVNEDHLAFMPIAQIDDLQMETPKEDEEAIEGPITKSFVLSANQLEDNITQILDFTFVDGYREPALAILYNTDGSSASLTNTWRMDTAKLVVLTLDIQAGARTAIFEISDLPTDLVSVSMVPDPIGGCLLIGTNEVIYVDPASRIVALAVNAFAKRASALSMRDYSQMNLRLEGAFVVPLQDGSSLDGILLILANGVLGLLTLNLDGRTVSSLHLKIVTDEFGGNLLTSGASCATLMANKRLFVGSRTGDSKLLAWRRKARPCVSQDLNDQIMQDAILDVEDEEIDNQDDLDDLYGDDTTEKKLFGAETTTFDLRFYLHDTILNQGPITGMCLGNAIASTDINHSEDCSSLCEIALVGGAGRAGNLTIYKRSISPEIIGKFDAPDWQALWTVKTRSSTAESDDRAHDSFDTYLMASKTSETQVFTIDTTFVEKRDSEFETSDPTVSVGTLMGLTCIVQICADMMRTYDAELRLLELKPTPEGSAIVSASIVDPYVLLVLDNAQIALYSGNSTTRELQELEHDLNSNTRHIAATLFTPTDPDTAIWSLLKKSPSHAKKRKRDQVDPEESDEVRNHCLCFTITSTGHLAVHQLPSMREVFHSKDLSLGPDLLLNDQLTPQLNGHSSQASTRAHEIVEIAVTELGESTREPFVVVRTRENEIICYKAFLNQHGAVAFSRSKIAGLSTRTALNNDLPHSSALSDDLKVCSPEMVKCDNVNGYACIYLKSGYWLLKTDQSMPSLHASGQTSVRSLSGFNTLDAPNGFIYCDTDSVIRICRFPTGIDLSNQWSRRPIKIGRSVHAAAYFGPHHVYAILTSWSEPYEIPDEEDEEWQSRQDGRETLPLLARGAIELIDGHSHKIIDRYDLADNEQGLCLKSVVLTIATDYTRKKRACLAVSTGILRGEDLAMRGAVYVFDVVEVVPEVGQPDAKFRLKVVCREEVRAAATTLCEVDGYLLSSQGQKVVVRSLEEDERLTPVAFVDLGLATSTAKSLRSMILFGDIQKGLRFVGFGEEPYKMTSFGRDYEAMDVVEAEFMVDGRNLYFAASDPQGNIRIMQYDPENPTTLAGSKLVRRADMHVGQVLSSMLLISEPDAAVTINEHTDSEKSFILCASQDGSLGALLPVSERSYRRLYTVQAQLASTELQIAGLNPRAYRLSSAEGLTSNPVRGILDGQLLSSFTQLSTVTQAQLAQKSGVGVKHVVTDLYTLGKQFQMF